MSEGQGAAPSAPTGAESTTTAAPKGAPAPGSKPGAAPSGQSVGEQVAAAVADGTLSEADLGRRVRVKVDGVEREVTLRDAMRDYELRAASHKRLEEAAKTRKEVEAERAQMRQLVELMRDPAGLLSLAQELGVTTQALREHIEREAAIPEDQKRLREIERRERALKERDEAEKKAREKAQADAETKRWREQYARELSQAAEAAGMKSPRVVQRMAQVMHSALESGVRMTAEEAAATVREELYGEVGALDADTLRSVLGDKLDVIRKQEVARATQGRDATRPRPGGNGGGSKAPQRERIPLGMLSPEELTERLNARRGR